MNIKPLRLRTIPELMEARFVMVGPTWMGRIYRDGVATKHSVPVGPDLDSQSPAEFAESMEKCRQVFAKLRSEGYL